MEAEQGVETDLRFPSGAKMAPRAVADGGGGTIIAVADISATPERVFDALSTDEVERWWRAPEYYFQRRPAGPRARRRAREARPPRRHARPRSGLATGHDAWPCPRAWRQGSGQLPSIYRTRVLVSLMTGPR
jgi:hypothetical protein